MNEFIQKPDFYDHIYGDRKQEEVSECCHAKFIQARSAEGWWINGELVHEWLECSTCFKPCDTIITT